MKLLARIPNEKVLAATKSQLTYQAQRQLQHQSSNQISSRRKFWLQQEQCHSSQGDSAVYLTHRALWLSKPILDPFVFTIHIEQGSILSLTLQMMLHWLWCLRWEPHQGSDGSVVTGWHQWGSRTKPFAGICSSTAVAMAESQFWQQWFSV